MIRILSLFISGLYDFTVSAEYSLSVVNILKEYPHTAKNVRMNGNGEYVFSVAALHKHTICTALDEAEVSYSISPLKGVPKYLLWLLCRPGILLGILMMIALSYYSSQVIWGFDVVGNSTVSDDEILLLLDELGCGYGDYIPSLDLDLIHATFLARSEDIAWIAVNLKGNFARVEVMETEKAKDDGHVDGVYANITASEDGQIYLVKTVSGVSVAKAGTVVKKGELLISGIIDVREDRVRYEYAEGEVLAYVPRTIEVKIPFDYAEKAYTGEEKTEKSIKIFKKSINLSSKGGIEYTVYDKIIDDRQICLFGVFPLPVWITDTTYREYEYSSEKHSRAQIVSRAMTALRESLDDVLLDAELISNKVSYEITDDAFVIKYDMLCLADISKVSEFTVENYTP